MKQWIHRGLAALCLAGLLAGTSARANYDDDDGYYGYEDGYDNYDNPGAYDDAEIYYEDHYGADNAYDLYFYRTLSPYGRSINLPGLGYVWRPFTVTSWLPYSVGYWGWHGGNWTWISYEPYGSVVYHYGNWAYLDSYGWCWFPGYSWAPHHVRWSSYDGYVGWCPTPPRAYHRSYRYGQDARHYVWVTNRNFLDRDITRSIVRPRDLWHGRREPRTLPVLSSPSRNVAERWSGRKAEDVRLERVSRSTRRGNFDLFVPDRQTRDRVRSEGSKITRPWLDTQRIEERRNQRPTRSTDRPTRSTDRPTRSTDRPTRSTDRDKTPWHREPQPSGPSRDRDGDSRSRDSGRDRTEREDVQVQPRRDDRGRSRDEAQPPGREPRSSRRDEPRREDSRRADRDERSERQPRGESKVETRKSRDSDESSDSKRGKESKRDEDSKREESKDEESKRADEKRDDDRSKSGRGRSESQNRGGGSRGGESKSRGKRP